MYKYIVFLVLLLCIIKLFLSKNTETFTINKNKSIIKKLTKEKFNFPKNCNFIYTSIDGLYHVFKDNTYYKINNDELIAKSSINEIFNTENLYINCGYYNYKNNTIALLCNNNIYVYDLFHKKLSKPIFFKKYFKNVTFNSRIKNLFYYDEKIYIFQEENVLIYDYNKEEIIEEKSYENLKKDITCIFINFNHIRPNHAMPFIYIIVNNNYYVCNSELKIISNAMQYNYGFLTNTANFVLNYSPAITNFTAPSDSYYRIICVGAGNYKGGYGGLIYNDFKLKQNDKINFIIGSSGERLPVSDNLDVNKKLLMKNSFKLDNTGSCSGSGGTFMFKNNKLTMVAGGGGGWSTELVDCPEICNSISYINKNKHKRQVYLPIKKIKIVSTSNYKTKIIIKKLTIKKDNKYLNFTINENDRFFPNNLETNYIYESAYNKNCYLTINLNIESFIVDYEFMIDYDIICKNNNKNNLCNNKLEFESIENVFSINNYNRIYNKQNFYDSDLVNIINKQKLQIKNNDKYVEPGNKKINSIKELINLDSLEQLLDKFEKNNFNKFIHLAGGLGGGGYVIIDRYINNISCGGGGGYLGGNGINIQDKNNKFNYISGIGGESFIKNNSFDINNTNLFINKFNNNNGYVIIYKINSDKINEDELKYKVNKNEFSDNKKLINKINHAQKIIDKINYRDIKGPEYKDNLNMSKNIYTLKFKLVEHFSNINFKLNSKYNVEVLFILLDTKNNTRSIIKHDSNEKNKISDNLKLFNTNNYNLVKLHEDLCKLNIYKYANSVNFDLFKNNEKIKKQLIKKGSIINLFSLKNKVIKGKHLDNTIKLNGKYDYLYIIIKNKNKNNFADYNVSMTQ